MCYACVEAAAVKNVRAGVRSLGGFHPGGTLAAAFSGGKISSVMLHLLSSMRCDDPYKRDKGQMPFSLHVIHINNDAHKIRSADIESKESNSSYEVDDDFHSPEERIISAVQTIAGTSTPVHFIDLSDIFLAEIVDKSARRDRLKMLFEAVQDPTSKTNLENYLHKILILRNASLHGCSHVAYGYTADSMAAQVVSSLSVGRGYAFSSEVATIDARYATKDPIIIRPMREVSQEEVSVIYGHLCNLGKVSEVMEETSMDKRNISHLASRFINQALQQNPGAVSNIMSAVGKVESFAWNDSSIVQSRDPEESTSGSEEEKLIMTGVEIFCPVCDAPLADDELEYCIEETNREIPEEEGSQEKMAPCCDSCRYGLLCGTGPSGLNQQLWDVMPKEIKHKAEILQAKLRNISFEPDAFDMASLRQSLV